MQLPLKTETEALRQAVRTAVANHPGLFVHFTSTESGVVQTVDEQLLAQAGSLAIEELQQTEQELAAYK